MFLCVRKLTERTVIWSAVWALIVVLTVSGGVFAASEADPNTQSVIAFVPKIYPAEAGITPTTGGSQIQSQPILIPAKKSATTIPGNADVIATPGSLTPAIPIKTSVPGISPMLVPELLKQPITLEQAILIAFQNNPNIQATLSLVEKSKESVAEMKAHFNPLVSAQASQTLQKSSAMTPGSVTRASVTVTMPIDISRQLKYSFDIANVQYQIQYLSMVTVSEKLIVDVKSAYYELLRTCGQKEVALAAVQSAEGRLANIKAKQEEGAVPRFDVTSAEVELSNLNQTLIVAQNQVYLAQSTLNGILGVDVNYPTQIISMDIPITISAIDIPKCVDDAYTRRPEIKSAQSSIALSKMNVTLQETGQAPQLIITAGPSYNFNPSGTVSKDSWQIMATASISLWDGGLTKARVNQAKASAKNSVSALDLAKITVATEVRRAALNMQEAALRTQTTAHSVSLAEDALSIANDRYDAGIAVLVEVTNAQTQLTQARFNNVNAQYDYAIALAQLQKATAAQPELDQLKADQSSIRQINEEVQS